MTRSEQYYRDKYPSCVNRDTIAPDMPRPDPESVLVMTVDGLQEIKPEKPA